MRLRRWLSAVLSFGLSYALAEAASAPPAPPSSPTDPSPLNSVPAPDLPAYRRRIADVLEGNILAFWRKHAPDEKHGGFVGELSHALVEQPDAARGALLTARILWTFSAAHRAHPRAADLALARRAFDDLAGRHWDAEHGGTFWSLAPDGQPRDTRKILYGQVFSLYAFAEFHRATGDATALARARELHRLIEVHGRDRVHDGYFEEFDRTWKLLPPGTPSAVGSRAAKSQNVHLHLMEAYAALVRADPANAAARADLAAVVDVMLTRILDAERHHLRLFLDADWTPRPGVWSYGHDIEAAWLLTDAAEALGDPALLARVRREAVAIADVTLREAIDPDGAVLYEGDARGATDTRKEWWPQAEAVVGFLNAWQISGERRFLDAALRNWDFIERHLVDREFGEWHRAVSRDHRVDRAPRLSFWKCPYHNGRACLEALARLPESPPIAPAP